MIIYKTTNNINGKIYIGKDSNNNPYYLGSGVYLKKSIKKYGRENFTKEIVEHCTLQNINEREIFWIDFYKSTNPKIGYNKTFGGDGANSFELYDNMDELRKKLSDAQKEIWSRPGMREKISKMHLGRKRPPETSKRISENKLEFYKVQENRDALREALAKTINSPERLKERAEAMKGKRVCELTEESINKIKNSMKSRWEDQEYVEKVKTNRRKALDEGRGKKSPEERKKQKDRQSKRRYEYSPEWELIKIWDSIKSITETNNVSHTWQQRYLNQEKLMCGSYWRSEPLEKDIK